MKFFWVLLGGEADELKQLTQVCAVVDDDERKDAEVKMYEQEVVF